MSGYTKLKQQGLKRGRPRLDDEQRIQRKELVGMRAEARRRAMIVLSRKHADEFEIQVEEELRQLKRERSTKK